MRCEKGTPEPICALNRVPLRECGEALVDIRRCCPRVRVSRKAIPFLREQVAEMLSAAQAALPAGYRLWVRTALRTLEMQREMCGATSSASGRSTHLELRHPPSGHQPLLRAGGSEGASRTLHGRRSGCLPADARWPPGRSPLSLHRLGRGTHLDRGPAPLGKAQSGHPSRCHARCRL